MKKIKKFVWGGEWDGKNGWIEWDGFGLVKRNLVSEDENVCECGATLYKMLGPNPRRVKVEVTW